MHVKVVENKEEEKTGIFRKMQHEFSNIPTRIWYITEKSQREAFGDFVPILKKYKAQDIIDIGCAKGHDSLFLTKRGFKVTDVDIQRRHTATVQKSAKKTGSDIDVLLCDAMKLPVRDGKFDAALSLYVFNPFTSDERVKAVSEMERILKPGGLILFLAGADCEGYDKTFSAFNDKGVRVVQSSSFSEKEVRELFKNFEFLVLKEITNDNAPPFQTASPKNWLLIARKKQDLTV